MHTAHHLPNHVGSVGAPSWGRTIRDMPAELLSEFFVLARTMNAELHSTAEFPSYRYRDAVKALPVSPTELLAFTRTCRFWRNAALGCPMLWTTIYRTYSPAIVRWMLDNSKGLPLTLSECYIDLVPNTTSALVWGQRSRLQSLDVLVFDPDQDIYQDVDSEPNHLFSRFADDLGPTSNLRTLRLLCDPCDPLLLKITGTTVFPELHYLYIKGHMCEDTQSLSAPKLRALVLHCPNGFDHVAMLSMLSSLSVQSPHLTYLTLGCDFREGQIDPHLSSSVALPNLVQLHIYGSCHAEISGCVRLLRIPSACHLLVSCEQSFLFDDDDINGIAKLVLERTDGELSTCPAGNALNFAYASSYPFFYMVIDSVERHPATMTAFAEKLTEDYCNYYSGLDCVRAASHSPAALMLNFGDPLYMKTHAASLMRGFLPLCALRSVYLSFDYVEGVDEWGRFFEHLSGVTTLHLDGINNYIPDNLDFFDATAPSPARVYFPLLDHLKLDGLYVPSGSEREFSRVLGTWLYKRRKYSGKTVERVEINFHEDTTPKTARKVLRMCQGIKGVEVSLAEPPKVNAEVANIQVTEWV